MRKVLSALVFAVALAACGSYNGGSTPAGGGATVAPQASGAAQTAKPTGDPNVDNYGY